VREDDIELVLQLFGCHHVLYCLLELVTNLPTDAD